MFCKEIRRDTTYAAQFPCESVLKVLLRNTRLGRLQREPKVRSATLQLLDHPFAVALFVLVGTRTLKR